MNKRTTFPLVILAFLIGITASYFFQDTLGAAQQPDHAKWGKIAITVVKENYTESEVSDYKYEGRKQLSDSSAEDRFLFQLKKNDKTDYVRVVVTFNTKTETLQSLQLTEVK
ncbi:hypothetical protein JOC85_000823 [Bacillus mesophilus]|uniref:DUF3889 domain-containing protein n=1 Tax=Bacillus mesophilus TaxID=1808955 RepID=A0A6M0QBD8_9BACI|nr:DUF3889 domain-containing protein [Bacillus mesophilus]MBM7660056.1 hypothetical protein [Bacillus mesophilus]NEY73711.1 DUF3889 domain-containing protein [Bacillus mesophilus]